MSLQPFQIKIFSYLPYAGIALFPFILLRKKEYKTDPVLINHERIHLRQQLEMAIIPFYIVYALVYLVNRLKGFSHQAAYRENIFEREAFTRQHDPDYLKHRPFWAFLKH